MKKWECTVCGYIHEGDEPPEKCPVCGAGPEYFKEVEAQEESAKTAVKVSGSGGVKKWECTVCGYIHEGEEPPEKCPVCSAGPEYFKEIKGQEKSAAAEAGAAGSGAKPVAANVEPTGLSSLVMKHHLHPITVHTPNGVLPLGLVFVFLATLFGANGFELAAFYNFVFVLLVMPAVIATGFIAWRYRYKGAKTKIFITKIGASFIVTVSLAALVIWHIVDPAVITSSNKWIYLLVCLIMVGAAGLAGHLGGKLVFGTRD